MIVAEASEPHHCRGVMHFEAAFSQIAFFDPVEGDPAAFLQPVITLEHRIVDIAIANVCRIEENRSATIRHFVAEERMRQEVDSAERRDPLRYGDAESKLLRCELDIAKRKGQLVQREDRAGAAVACPALRTVAEEQLKPLVQPEMTALNPREAVKVRIGAIV